MEQLTCYRRGGKRTFDIALSGFGLMLFALPMVGIAAWIRFRSGAPVFFTQKRIGYRGGPFTILKFRTLSEGKQISSPFSQQLRGTAMDELPQLINILRGEMSFVGPRPLIPEELEVLDKIPNGTDRFSTRPGLTGLAQLYDAKVPTLPQRIRWDLMYVSRCSFGLDIWIILKSILITCRGAWEHPGAIQPRKIP